MNNNKETFNLNDFHRCILNNDTLRFNYCMAHPDIKQNIDLIKESKNNALHLAINENNVIFVRELINAGANQEIKNINSDNALFAVCANSSNNHKLYQDILSTMVNLKTRAKLGINEFTNVSKKRKKHLDNDYLIAQLLIKNFADVTQIDENKNNCLHKAMPGDDLPLIMLLIDSGCDLMAKNSNRITPFSIAIKEENSDILKTIFSQIKTVEEIKMYSEDIKETPDSYFAYETLFNSIEMNSYLKKILSSKTSNSFKITEKQADLVKYYI